MNSIGQMNVNESDFSRTSTSLFFELLFLQYVILSRPSVLYGDKSREYPSQMSKLREFWRKKHLSRIYDPDLAPFNAIYQNAGAKWRCPSTGLSHPALETLLTSPSLSRDYFHNRPTHIRGLCRQAKIFPSPTSLCGHVPLSPPSCTF